MNVQPYLYFGGKSEEAIDFYKGAIGAKVEMLMHFKDMPGDKSMIPPGSDGKVMHACIKVGDSPIFLSDGNCDGKPAFSGVTLTINATSDAEADKLFAALGQGGKVQMPIAETFFATRFGMVADKFGVSWMVINSEADGLTLRAQSVTVELVSDSLPRLRGRWRGNPRRRGKAPVELPASCRS